MEGAMRLRHQYLIVGIAWALLLGPAACLLLFGFAAGASWLWLFGDSPWPDATQWLLPLVGVIGGTLTALACVLVGYGYGRTVEKLRVTGSRTEQRKGLVLTVTPLALLVLVSLYSWRQSRNYTHDMEVAAQREAAFAALINARHRITGITLDRSEHDNFRAIVEMMGEREGSYHLHWQVADTGFRTTLASGDSTIELRPGRAEAEITFTLGQLAQNYQAKVLRGAGGALVEESFELVASLWPLFNESGRKTLPPGERRRLDKAESPLRSQKITHFPVRLLIRKGSSEK
jgi:hypothetical protein